MADLPTLHTDLLATLDELEAVTNRPCCDVERLTRARYRVSRISSERRRVVDELCRDLATTASPSRAAALDVLRQANMEARVRATAHIGQWTLQEAVANWPSYCNAAARVRSLMRAQIRHEQLLLCPEQPQAA